MRPEDVPDEWVEKAARAWVDTSLPDNAYGTGALDRMAPMARERFLTRTRHALAAVLPEIQAQALRDAAMVLDKHNGMLGVWGVQEALMSRAARLTATTEEES